MVSTELPRCLMELHLNSPPMEKAIKPSATLVMTTESAAAYWVIVNVFGITEILEEFGDFGKYSVLVLLAFANVFFVIYDGAVKNITLAYRNWFRPKILKKVR